MLANGDGCDSIALVTLASESLPTNLAAAHAMILAERQARLAAEAEAASAQADLSSSAALIAHLKLEIEKLRRTLYGARAQRQRPVRKPFPDDIRRERVVLEAPSSCPCCGGSRLSKLGEDVTETLELIPRQWKVIETVREKFSCRDCEA